MQTFIDALSDIDAHSYLLRRVEAMVERDLMSGEAVDGHGFSWPSIQARRGCRVVFHMDRTSKAAMTDSMLAENDEERGQKSGIAFYTILYFLDFFYKLRFSQF